MPTDDEIKSVAKMARDYLRPLKTYRMGKMSIPLLGKLTEVVPGLTDVYGPISGFNSEVPVNYITITDEQMRMLDREVNPKVSMFDTHHFTVLFFAVKKKEEERLSSVTDPSKIVFGGA